MPTVLLVGLVLGWIASQMRVDLMQFVCLAPAAVLCWSSRARDLDTERSAPRPTGWLDGTWWCLGTLGSALLAALALSPGGGIEVMGFVPLCILAASGVTAVAARWLPLPEALGMTVLLFLASYVTRYVVGPPWALIHQESPRPAAAAVSASLLLVGCASFAIRRRPTPSEVREL